ncbi:transposase [Mycobacterium avium subsp. hominissuis]|uniref:Transposase n=1 Tax=Mycobacterium avium subsp. hominissuis TaxID=439334 RepID=A0A2A3LD05_MYCAV|nr:transposase [Mycobacterium avium subsp. hominissuis]
METLAAPIGSCWVPRLDTAVRPEFRTEVLVPAVADPILGSPACAVTGCVRSSRYGGLCPAHLGRWRKAGRPDRQAWAATADPEVMGHRPLQSCLVPGCGFGQHRYRLCYQHSRAWDKAGRPAVDQWTPQVAGTPAAVCAIPGCALWAELDAGWCHSHHRRWRLRGRPPAAEFIAYCASYGEDRFDLRLLTPQLRLEIQYALQCRVDANRTHTTPRSIKPLLDHLAATGAESLLERPLDDWLVGLPAAAALRTPRAFLAYAIERLLDLRDGIGWDSEYQRDVWLLRRLGVTGHDGARLDFTVVQPGWLRDLAKRWCRWRMSCGIGLSRLRGDRRALVHLSQFTPGLASSSGPGALDRGALEAYLARLAVEIPHPKTRSAEIGSVTGFLNAVRQHRWALLPAEAQLYPSDQPRRDETPAPRAIPEFIMGQLENPANLGRISDPRIRLLVEILIRSGLRIGDATRLELDCLVRDPQDAVYLRYRNHKMRRDAMVPIDDELAAMITAQQTRTRLQFPATSVLLPRSSANPDGRLPMPTATFHLQLGQWLETCGVTDELGQPVHVTAHQFRHTAATRWINHDVPQEVVRRLLDHTSHTMTAVYARLADTTIREQWERAQKINIRGEPVETTIDGALADGEWMKQNLARAKMALPNGYCGLPLQKSCPHANACLTCPLFITTAEFLPQHHKQLDDTRALIARAETDGHTRLAEMNRTVETNLLTIITTLEDHQHDCPCQAGVSEISCGKETFNAP